ncbi:MAG: hypothetical protein MZV63_19620 [Marinilabiliales bacterium]|nr:hypothetical protein [Marinilabiliales bacterium]
MLWSATADIRRRRHALPRRISRLSVPSGSSSGRAASCVAAALPLARCQRSDFLAREGTHRLLEMHPICERGEQGEALHTAWIARLGGDQMQKTRDDVRRPRRKVSSIG